MCSKWNTLKTLDPNSSQEENDKYAQWIKADKMARCYIPAAMSRILLHQHQSYIDVMEIMFNLNEMFGDYGRLARQAAMKALMSTKMRKGTPVQ